MKLWIVQIHAVVFDSNVFGHQVTPNVQTIGQWARSCSAHGAALWIPEVVAAELAEHAVREHTEFMESYEAHRARLGRWGVTVPASIASLSTTDIIRAIEGAGAEIVPLSGDAAREAVLDQVLLRGSGARKGPVKTGAADSAWLRSVIEHNGGDFEGVFVVTGDVRALISTCAELGLEQPAHAPHLGDAHARLGETQHATAERPTILRNGSSRTFWCQRGEREAVSRTLPT